MVVSSSFCYNWRANPLNLDSTVVNANCGLPDGSACVLATGGTAPYSYLWPDGSTNSCATNLLAGTYCVEVTDNKACISIYVLKFKI